MDAVLGRSRGSSGSGDTFSSHRRFLREPGVELLLAHASSIHETSASSLLLLAACSAIDRRNRLAVMLCPSHVMSCGDLSSADMSVWSGGENAQW